MKSVSRFILLLFCFTIYLLSESCSTGFSIRERKYFSGFYIQQVQRRGVTGAKGEARNEAPDSSQSKCVSIVSIKTDGVVTSDTLQEPVSILQSTGLVRDTVAHSGMQVEPLPVKNTSNQNQDPKPEEEEAEIKKTSRLAIFTYFLTFLCLFGFLMPTLLFIGLLAVLLVCCIGILIHAKRVKVNHPKKEKYPGRGKIVAATIVAVIGIALIALCTLLLSVSA